MKRRDFLTNLATVVGGTLLLPKAVQELAAADVPGICNTIFKLKVPIGAFRKSDIVRDLNTTFYYDGKYLIDIDTGERIVEVEVEEDANLQKMPNTYAVIYSAAPEKSI